MRPKPNNCLDCSTPVRKESARCRVCQTRRAQKGSVVARRIIPGRRLTGQEAMRRWRSLNPERNKETARTVRQRVKQRIDEFKAERGCEDCGNSDPRVLDLHHRHGEEKVDHVNRLRTRTGWDAVRAEMEKCDVVCANCHRIRHAEDFRSSSRLTGIQLALIFAA